MANAISMGKDPFLCASEREAGGRRRPGDECWWRRCHTNWIVIHPFRHFVVPVRAVALPSSSPVICDSRCHDCHDCHECLLHLCIPYAMPCVLCHGRWITQSSCVDTTFGNAAIEPSVVCVVCVVLWMRWMKLEPKIADRRRQQKSRGAFR